MERLSLCSSYGPFLSIRCALCTVYFIQYTVHSIHYTVHGTRYTVHGTRYTVHGTRYTVHGTLYAFFLEASACLVSLNRLSVGCGTTPRRQSGDCQLFNSIRMGLNNAAVSRILFNPVVIPFFLTFVKVKKKTTVYCYAPKRVYTS